MQRLLARFGYIRLADHGLVMTRYGVVRSPQEWQKESAAWPYGAPMAGYAAEALPYVEHPTASLNHATPESLTPITMNEVTGLQSRADTDSGDGNTTVAQPLRDYHLPLSAEQERALVVDLVAPTSHDDEEKTLFSPPPIHAPPVSTPPPS